MVIHDLTYRIKLNKSVYWKLAFLEPPNHTRDVLSQMSAIERRFQWLETYILRKHTTFHTTQKLLACLLSVSDEMSTLL